MTVRRLNGFLTRFYRALRAWRPTGLFVSLLLTVILLAQVVPAQDESEAAKDSGSVAVVSVTASGNNCLPLEPAKQHWTDRWICDRIVLDNGLTVLNVTAPASAEFFLCMTGRRPIPKVEKEAMALAYFCMDYLSYTLARYKYVLGTDLVDGFPFHTDTASLLDIELSSMQYPDRTLTILEGDSNELASAFKLLASALSEQTVDSSTFHLTTERPTHLRDPGLGKARDSAVAVFNQTLLASDHATLLSHEPGDPSSVIDLNRFTNFRRRFFSPENLIVAVVSPLDSSAVFSDATKILSQLSPDTKPFDPFPTPEPPLSAHEVNTPTVMGETVVVAGGLVPGSGSADYLPLKVATRILSHRLRDYLRDKRNMMEWAGVATEWLPEFGWYYVFAQSDSADARGVLGRLRLQAEKLALDGPVGDEVACVQVELWEAYRTLCSDGKEAVLLLLLSELSGAPLMTGNEYLEALAKVDEATVRRGAARYFRPDLWTISIVEPTP